jgi:glycosyltransferase involved in cell wall biosynthesis
LPVYSVAPRSGRIKAAVERSPRITIVTDASRVEAVPEAVRSAAEMISTEDVSTLRGSVPKGEADGFLTWLEGEELLQGTSADLRGFFFHAHNSHVFLPVHLACLAEADFVSLQPRISFPKATKHVVNCACRIRGSFRQTGLAQSAWSDNSNKNGNAWAKLHVALLREIFPGGGIEALKQLWQREKLPPFLASLVLRNLILALLRAKQAEKARELLTLGAEAYPGYADLHFLSAVLWLYKEKASKAFAELEFAIKTGDTTYVGSGGEESYRSSWLLGTIYEDMGEERQATTCYMAGLMRRPAFGPSVAAILQQRFSRFRAEQLSLPLCELARREPAYLVPVFDFCLRHRAFDAPRRLLKTLPLTPELCERLSTRLTTMDQTALLSTRDGLASASSIASHAPENPGVILEGPFLSISGHARINRELGCELLDSKCCEAALEPSEPGTRSGRLLPDRERIVEGLRRVLPRVDLTIRHFWPPDFRRARTGALTCIVPWEHRAVPRAWVREIERSVDELWAPSEFVARAFIEAGVCSDRVQVLPYGFHPAIFNCEVKPWRPPGCRGCVFLYVGGTIRRKGTDLLLQAYADAFSPNDDVTLVIKDTGSTAFYQHSNLLSQIRSMMRRTNTPHLVLLTQEIDDAKLASLYRGCDAFVFPSRGEGFGMPLVEAMACGKPVVTTHAGPAREFCRREASYLIRATETRVPDIPPSFGEFSGEWTWFEPDLAELASAMRSVYENREEAAERGARAARQIAQTHAWANVLPKYLERIAQLTAGFPQLSVAGS